MDRPALCSPYEELVRAVERRFWGKRAVVEKLVCALLAGGHVLIEDVPGVGKTTLVQALAAAVDASFSRIQFTADLLPSDIVGVTVWREESDSFVFKKGPVFANLVLADEINRATPRTQSALLEAMSEYQVSVDGITYPLEPPFMVVATQNAAEHHGTYPLPESQLDRFAMRLSIGYPDPALERRIALEATRKQDVPAVLNAEKVAALQKQVEDVHVDASVADYVVAVVQSTREHDALLLGAGPRAAATWVRCARAWAAMHGRGFVTPDDVQAMAVDVLAHRLISRDGSARIGEQVVRSALGAVAVPV